MKKFLQIICIANLLLWCDLASSGDLVIEITRGVDNPTAIAIVPFQWMGKGYLSENVSQIVSDDLKRSGQFDPLAEKDMPLALPHQQSDVVFGDWRKYGMEYIVIGRIEPKAAPEGYRISFELYDVHGARQLFSKTAAADANSLRDLAHYVSDQVYEALTGFRGHFSTQILYVRATRDKGRDKFQLLMADQDGARVRELLNSREPIMSPTWSPDHNQVAYVSFENHRPAIFRQVLATGQREQLTNFPGLNNAPAWSPDGKRMAMVLSKDDNPEIYVMELDSGELTRLTDHFAIDTEPTWTPDGQYVVFTSSRSGHPQIYRVLARAHQTPERLTFNGNYNARPRVTPDGKQLVYVHREDTGDVFHIAIQDMDSKQIKMLTQTRLDESPSLSPNGRMIIYATKEGDRGILAGVSVDGGVKVRLPSEAGDVREPAWSPFR